MATIVIDPGHGGASRTLRGSSWNNAKGPRDTLEKDICLEIGLLVASKLSRRHNVILTRSTNVNVGLPERAEVAKRTFCAKMSETTLPNKLV